jgi:RimJ/RimL family protein N-acetyltransferase
MSDLLRGPAYRIETDRLVLRCFDPNDAVLLKSAVDASLGELLPWIPWARDEPTSLDAKIELLRVHRGRFDLGQDQAYGVFDPSETEVLGGIGFHDRVGEGAREIGYWIASKHAGRGLATEATAALVRVGFEIARLDRIEIHCDPANLGSVAIPRKLGFRHDGTLRARHMRRRGPPADSMIVSLLADEYADSPAARARVGAFDAVGRTLLDPADERSPRRRSAFF